MTVYFHPDHRFIKTRVCHAIGAVDDIHIGNKHNYDICFHWDYHDVNDVDEFLMEEYEKGKRIVNYWLRNVTKKAVDEYMTSALGYSSLVDDSYDGIYVSKRNKQSRGMVELRYNRSLENENEGLSKYSPNYRIHQKLIDTEEDGICKEQRVFVFGDRMFTVTKSKIKGHRFRSNATDYKLVDMNDVFTRSEIDGIHRFCVISGLDFGEIDVLRDKEDGRIYITDINNISGGGTFFLNIDSGRVFDEYVEYFKVFISN